MTTYRLCWQQAQGYSSDKWDHYLDVYDRYLSKYKEILDISYLEIGVQNGGGLSTARKFLHHSARLYGLDIEPSCSHLENDGLAERIYIGAQTDQALLTQVVSDTKGSLKIVIDDGSHQQDDMIDTFRFLFPHVGNDGVYIIEDTHTVFFPDHQRSESGLNVYDYFKSLTDKLTLDFIDPEHRKDRFFTDRTRRGRQIEVQNAMTRSIGAIHFYNSMIVVEKKMYQEPLRVVRRVGIPVFP